MIRINLLPVRVSRKKQAGRQQLAIMAVALVAAVACNFVWSRIRGSDLAAREARLRNTRAEIAQLERIIGEVQTIKAQQAAVKDKLAVLEKLKAGRQGPVRVLDELATIVPKKVWFRKVDEKSGAMTFEGVGGSIDDVSAFLAALKRSKYFSAVELRKTTARKDGQLKLVDFTITASVDYTPAIRVAVAAPSTVAGPDPEKR